jgi:hypothetical protein
MIIQFERLETSPVSYIFACLTCGDDMKSYIDPNEILNSDDKYDRAYLNCYDCDVKETMTVRYE